MSQNDNAKFINRKSFNSQWCRTEKWWCHMFNGVILKSIWRKHTIKLKRLMNKLKLFFPFEAGKWFWNVINNIRTIFNSNFNWSEKIEIEPIEILLIYYYLSCCYKIRISTYYRIKLRIFWLFDSIIWFWSFYRDKFERIFRFKFQKTANIIWIRKGQILQYYLTILISNTELKSKVK